MYLMRVQSKIGNRISSRRLANSFNRECASKDEISEDPMLVGMCINRISMETLAWKSVPS